MTNKLLFIFFSFFSSVPDNLQIGIDYFNARSENAKGLLANIINIDKAIQIFETELLNEKNKEKAAYYYLSSLNFKGQFVYTKDADKKNVYKKAVEKGNALIKEFPKSAYIRFELITSIGLLAEMNGALKSAESGVVNQMLFHSNMLIKTDSMYRCCAGWKVLSILHYKTPYIPLILTWPSNKTAKELLFKALKYYPADISNNYYYAEALLESGDKTNAKIYFQLVTKFPSRKEFYLEDENQKEKAKRYLADWN